MPQAAQQVIEKPLPVLDVLEIEDISLSGDISQLEHIPELEGAMASVMPVATALRPKPESFVQALQSQSASSIASLHESEGLRSAFQMFSQMSEQLADSYGLLETRVADLNKELHTVDKQRLDELAEKERLANRLENLLNVLPGGVVVLDAKGRVAECNPVAREMLGEPLEGLTWREVTARCFAPRSDDGHEMSTHDGRRIGIATRSLDTDGQIILLTDQTETRRLQSELSRHERLSALGKMVSALAHQIRTPLSAAMLYAGHLCNKKVDGEKRQQFSEKLLRRLNHMERQVQDMLLFVKGELPLNDTISADDLQELLEDEVEVVLSTSGAECSWSNACGDKFIRCNREALVGALLNLMNNSIQAVDDQARLNVRFTLLNNDYLAVSVIDHGPGIPDALMQTVGDLFVTTKSQGTGLGLSVVQAVAKAHRGRFVLKSQPGRGTCATIILPLAD